MHKPSIIFLISIWTISLFAETKPNIVFILVDDHAWEAVSAYGTYLKDYAKTPNIDRLAKEGMLFDNFVCSNSICSPSRASFITGQYSHKNGVFGLNGRINEQSPWISEELQKAGYKTYLVGKWHLKGKIKGFHKYMTVKGQGKYFNPTFSGSEGNRIQKEGYSTDVYTDIALEWLGKRDKNKPFFLSLNFKAPHHEFGHAKRHDHLLEDATIPEPPTLYEDIHAGNSNLKKAFLNGTKFHMTQSKANRNYYLRHLKDKAPNQMWPTKDNSNKEKTRVAYQHMIHKYIRCISGNDDNVKRVLDYLDKEKIKDNTIVIYTSDQGYWLGQHGFYDKRLILETSIRMPFLIRYPKLIPPSSINNDICINTDLAPTLLDLAGADVPKSMQGKSMVKLLKGLKTLSHWRRSSFYAYYGGPPQHYGIRDKRYTYTHIKGLKPELFDRKKDPKQLMNVFNNPEYFEVIKQCEIELAKQIKELDIDENILPK